MKQQKHVLSIVLILLSGAFTALGEEPTHGLMDGNAQGAEAPTNPNHLEPMQAYAPDGYDQAVFRSLIGNDPGELWMVGKPSFSPEYAVILRHEIKYAKPGDFLDRTIESEKWIVEYAVAKNQIWRWKEVGGGRTELDIHVTKDIIRHRAEVTKEFGLKIFAAWEAVLRVTRYPDADYRGLDGVTIQFYCRPNLFGEIWTPNAGLPKMLTKLGGKLADIAEMESQYRPKIVADCTDLAKKIVAETHKPEQDAPVQPANRTESQ